MSKLRILCFGDSLTAGYTNYGSSFQPYYEAMVSKLKEAFPGRDIEAQEDGMSGGLAREFPNRLTQAFRETRTANPYDWTIVLGGTNDLAYGFEPEQIFESLERTWLNAVARKSRVLALTVPELGVQGSGRAARVNPRRDRLNELILGYKNDNVYSFDFKSAFSYTSMNESERQQYWDDGVHFTADGYDLMGRQVAAALVNVFNTVEVPASKQPPPVPRHRRKFRDDDKTFEEETEDGSPEDLQRGYIVVRRKDLD